MQNIPVLPNVDHTDVVAAVGLIPGACAREMYRPAYANSSHDFLVAILAINNMQNCLEFDE
jgi:hypothetical protein